MKISNYCGSVKDSDKKISDSITKDKEKETFKPTHEPKSKSKLHPNLKINYFKTIDSKEKAYWLGFIYADGGISLDKNSVRFKIEISKKDEILINSFSKAIGFNLKYKSYQEKANTVRIRFVNKIFTNNLIEHGIIFRKSNIIELPKLNNRELYLAFLLGYFDGDGTEGTSKITSGSIIFLKQIKRLFNIKSNIHEKYSYGKSYDLYLGGKLFNEILDNYIFSLDRKRKKFSSNEQRITKIKENAWKEGNKKKLLIKKEELKKLVWEKPKIEIAKQYGVSDVTIGKYCRKWNIKTPHRGYWI